jgi:hypothetical protein
VTAAEVLGLHGPQSAGTAGSVSVLAAQRGANSSGSGGGGAAAAAAVSAVTAALGVVFPPPPYQGELSTASFNAAVSSSRRQPAPQPQAPQQRHPQRQHASVKMEPHAADDLAAQEAAARDYQPQLEVSVLLRSRIAAS